MPTSSPSTIEDGLGPLSPIGPAWEIRGNDNGIDELKEMLRESQEKMDLRQQAQAELQQESLKKINSILVPIQNETGDSRIRALKAQIRGQEGQLQRLAAFQQRIEQQNDQLQNMMQQMSSDTAELNGILSGSSATRLTDAEVASKSSISSVSVFEPLKKPVALSVERWEGINNADSSWIISNGKEMILVDVMESADRAKELVEALLQRPESLQYIILTGPPKPRAPLHLVGESISVLREGLEGKAKFIVATDEMKAGIFDSSSDIVAEVLPPGSAVLLQSGGG